MTDQPSWAPTRRAAITGAGALIVSGCTLLKSPIIPKLYVLRPSLATQAGPPVRWRLALDIPDTAQSLDTARIALTRSTTMMDYFANAEWTDRVPQLLQRLLLQAFEMSGRIVSVARDISGLENDYLLETDVRDFEAQYDSSDGAPQIVVAIQAKLVKMPDRIIVKSLNVTHQARAGANNLDSIVGAFNEAAGAAITEITAWTLSAPAPSAG